MVDSIDGALAREVRGRHDVQWLSNETPGLVDGVVSDPHGEWIRWSS